MTIYNIWPTKKLGDSEVCTIIMGQSPSSSTYNQIRNGLPFYQGKKDFGAIHPIPSVWCTLPSKTAEANDVLISVRAPIGPVNLCPEKSAIGRGLAALRANSENLYYRFLFLYLRQIENNWTKSGTTFGAITKDDLKNLKIPLPPLPIQKQIVARIDGLFERIDKAIELRKRALEETEQIFPSALQEVFSEAEKKWGIKKLDEISVLQRGPFGGSLKKEIFIESGYKVYEQRNTIYNDFTLGSYFVTEEKYNKMISFAVKPGDLIISCSGTIGRVAIVPSNALPGIINQALLKITPISEYILSSYLKVAIEAPQIQARLFPSLGSAIKNVVSVRKIKNTSIPLPSLSEQKRIVSYLGGVREKVEKLKDYQESQLKDLEELKQSILEKAFNGELIK